MVDVQRGWVVDDTEIPTTPTRRYKLTSNAY